MRLSIGLRLFLAVLLAFLAVAALGVGLVRWRLLDHGTARAPADELALLDALVDDLAARYRQQRDWSFLPPLPAARKRWLRDAFARTPLSAASSASGTDSNSLGYRIGLLDREQRYLAGAIAHPALIAFASIDTRQRAIAVDGATVGYLVLAKPENAEDEIAVAFLIQQQNSLFVIVLIGLVSCALSAALLAAHFRRPIRELVAGARRLGPAQLDTRLPAQRSDELGELARAFNGLAARLEEAERSRRQWIADTSHELRTPLSVLRGQLEALQDGIRSATPANIALLLQQVLSLSRRVDDLYALARADVGDWHLDTASVDAWRLLQETVADFAEKLRGARLSVTTGASPARAGVQGDAERLRQVFANLIENSVRYTDAGGTLHLHAAVVGETLQLIIDDSAPGVADDCRNRLGERFFRVDALRNRQPGGAGLGLALSRQIIEAHDGRLTFAASPLGGLRAVIALPLER